MDRHAPELSKMIRRLAPVVDIRTDPTTKHASTGRPGRTDSIVTLPSSTVFIEVKSGINEWRTFRPNQDDHHQWTVKQREYAIWVEQELGKSAFICLFIGKHPPHLDASRYEPRRAYIIPSMKALEVVNVVESAGLNSIPYRIRKGGRKFFKDSNICCVESFKPYELTWVNSEIGWDLPEGNPLYPHIFPAQERIIE